MDVLTLVTTWTQWDAQVVGASLLVVALLTRWLGGRGYHPERPGLFRVAAAVAVAALAVGTWLLWSSSDYGGGSPGIWSAVAVISALWYAADVWRYARGLPPLHRWFPPRSKGKR